MVHKALSIGSGQFNPHVFYYPTLHLYLLAATFGAYFAGGYAVGAFPSLQDFELSFFLDPSPFHLLGRSLSALMGTASVWLTYRIAQILGGRRAGQISALFLAVCFLHVRDSHFATTDVPATFYLLASCVLTMRYTQSGAERDLYLGSALFGLGVSTKYNVAFCAVTVLITALHGAGPIRKTVRRLLVATGFMTLAFVIGSPYIALDFTAFWRDIHSVRALMYQEPPVDLGRGWLYYPGFVLPLGLGWPLLCLGLAGAVRWTLRMRLAEVALLAGLASYYLMTGSGKMVYFRYTLPMIPLLCLAAGLLVNAIARTQIRAWATALIIAAPTAWASYSHDQLLARTDTRLLAVQWIEEHVPAGAKIARCCSTSLFGHPQLQLTATAAERQRSELSQTGQTFRRWRYLQAINDNISRPSYDIVELRRSDLSGYSWIWSQYDLDRLQRDGVDWVVVQEHPHLSFSNADAPFVDSLAKHPVHIFDPFLSAATPRYDQIDAYYLPVSGFAGVDRAGPKIAIYRISTGLDAPTRD